MRTPKIGDIVLYEYYKDKNKYAAIVVKSDVGTGELVLEVFGAEFQAVGTFYHEKSWSWPEEEKQCEHDYQDICLPKMPPVYQKKCSKCGDVKQETPKECEHDYLSVYQVKCSKCNHIEIEASNQYFVPAAKKMAKAGELIDKIWNIVSAKYEFETEIQDIHDLIKEYKGLK